MPWLYIVIAGLLEVAWAIGLKYADGFTRLWPSLWTIVGMIASFFVLAQGVRTLPIGTGYAVWTGIGAVGTTALGILILKESADPLRLACIGLIVIGIIGLKLVSPH
jgi:quaternary ammonium compound-resistance protein SugE